MWKRPGGYYHNRGKHSVPGSIELVPDADGEWRRAYSEGKIELAETARLTEKMLREKAKEIEKFFGGAEVWHLIRADRTILIEDE